MSVTMRDVACRAGVSIKMVSRVVNDQGEISEATRQRVLAAIEELGRRVPRYELGEMVMEMLLRVMDADGDHEELLYVQPELVARGSCGAPGTVGADAVQVT